MPAELELLPEVELLPAAELLAAVAPDALDEELLDVLPQAASTIAITNIAAARNSPRRNRVLLTINVFLF